MNYDLLDWGDNEYANPGKEFEMKPNEIVLTVVQIAAPIFCFAVGLVWQGLFLCAWILFFATVELVLKWKTGKTLSSWVWTKPIWVRIVLSILMTAGMIALGVHFIWGGGA